MFTGIVESTGSIAAVERNPDSAVITITAPKVLSDATLGASIAVDGVCLTVIGFTGETFRADVMLETLQRTTLGKLEPGSAVNLERAMPANGRFGGHIVQGHIDGTGTVEQITVEDDWTTMRFSIPREISPYIVEKGSITVNGVSLTVVAVSEITDSNPQFSVSLIPTTLAETNLGSLAVGDSVNIEVDALAKYVERLIKAREVSQS